MVAEDGAADGGRDDDGDFMSADAYGRSLRGFGVNMLVRDVGRSLTFLSEILLVEKVYADRDFAVCRH